MRNNLAKTKREVIEEDIKLISFPENTFFPHTKPHSVGSKPDTLLLSFSATLQQEGTSSVLFITFFLVAHHQLSSNILPKKESIRFPTTAEKTVISTISTMDI